MRAAEEWLDEVSELTGRDLERVKAEMREEYDRRLEPIRRRTAGRTAVVVVRPSSDYSWLFETLEDLGVDVLRRRESTYNRWLMGQAACDDKRPYLTATLFSMKLSFVPIDMLTKRRGTT